VKNKYFRCAECNKKVENIAHRVRDYDNKDGCFAIDKTMTIKVLCKECMKIFMVRYKK